MANPELTALLKNGASSLKITLTKQKLQQLLDLVNLLIKWNQTYNLSAIKQPKDIIIKHILDSMSVLAFIDDAPLLDIGSGAGFPAIVIAIFKANSKIILLERSAKKCYFMRLAAAQLALKNVVIIHSRIENYHPQKCCLQIISRAFANVYTVWQLTERLLCAQGRCLLMKSARFKTEPKLPEKIAQHSLNVPFLNDNRYLLILRKT